MERCCLQCLTLSVESLGRPCSCQAPSTLSLVSLQAACRFAPRRARPPSTANPEELVATVPPPPSAQHGRHPGSLLPLGPSSSKQPLQLPAQAGVTSRLQSPPTLAVTLQANVSQHSRVPQAPASPGAVIWGPPQGLCTSHTPARQVCLHLRVQGTGDEGEDLDLECVARAFWELEHPHTTMTSGREPNPTHKVI